MLSETGTPNTVATIGDDDRLGNEPKIAGSTSEIPPSGTALAASAHEGLSVNVATPAVGSRSTVEVAPQPVVPGFAMVTLLLTGQVAVPEPDDTFLVTTIVSPGVKLLPVMPERTTHDHVLP